MEKLRKPKHTDDNKEKPSEQRLSENREKYWRRLSEIVWETPKKYIKKSTSSS